MGCSDFRELPKGLPDNHIQNTDDPAEVRSQQVQQKLPLADGGSVDADHNWPQWRGPLGTGVAPHANPPVEWSEKKNIRWKIEIPALRR